MTTADLADGPTAALTERVISLLEETRQALLADERADDLAETLSALDDSPIRIALAGPHNAGKSMLVAALLRLPQDQVDAITGAVPKTDRIEPYDWNGHVLLDLPGTQSGFEEHDSVAAAGVRTADVLLLVTSVELPGEAETAQIVRLLDVEGFGRRAVIVLNKCNSEDNDLELVRADMLHRLEAFPWIEPMFADALQYVRALNYPGYNDDDRAFVRSESRVDDVVAALQELAGAHGRTARLAGLCHEVRRTADEASSRWDRDQQAEARELTADRIRAALADARASLADAVDLAVGTLADAIAGIGNGLAVAISEEDGSLDPRRLSRAEAEEDEAYAACATAVNSALEEIFPRLDVALGVSLSEWQRYSTGGDGPGNPISASPVKKKPGMIDGAVANLWNANARKAASWFNEVLEEGVREGSRLHKLAKKINDQQGVLAKAYTHINKAKQLQRGGRALKNVAEFAAPAIDLKGVVDHLRRTDAIKKKRQKIRAEYDEDGRTAESAERDRVQQHTDELLGRREEQVGAMLEAADQVVAARSEAQRRWAAVSTRAVGLAAEIDQALVR